MSETKVAIKLTTLDDICDAVREVEGTTELIPIAELKPRILALVNIGENKLPQYFTKTLTELTVADFQGAEAIPTDVFRDFTILESVEMPDSITDIGTSAFYNCSRMKNIKLSNGVTVLREYTLYGCTSLEVLILPSNLISILNNACYKSGIKELIMPNTITTMDGYVFQGCANLDKVYYKGTIEDWCQINITNANANPITPHGAEFYYTNSAGEYELLTDFMVPDAVTTIPQFAFYNARITTLTVPNTVELVGRMAFANCTNLTSIIIDAAHIGQQCFVYSDNVSAVIVGSNVAQIDSGAFQCGSSIGSQKPTFTFLGTTPPTIASGIFATSKIKKIIVPKGCGEAYKTATNWSNFADYIEEAE